MADEHRVSRKEQERRKGWIGIAVWIGAIGLLFAIFHFAPSIGSIPGERFYIYFDESVAGLLPNSKVKFRGVEAGRVTKIELTSERRTLHADGTLGPNEPLGTPLVEVEIAIQNEDAILTDKSRAFLKTNPLSGMQQIDINDSVSGRGAELKLPDEGNADFACELFGGGVDLSNWIAVAIDKHKTGSVAAIDFSTEPGAGHLATVHINIPYRYRNLDATALRAWSDASVEKGRAVLSIVPREEASGGMDSYPITRVGPRHLTVELPAAALGIDPVIRGKSVETAAGGQHTEIRTAAAVSHLVQLEREGRTGSMVKYLSIIVAGSIEPVSPNTDADGNAIPFSRFLGIERSLTGGDRYFEAEILFRGTGLPEGAPIQVASSPLALLLERAEVLAEFIDYLPSIARNTEEAAANVVNITAELKDAVGVNSEKLGAAITSLKDDLKNSLLAKIESLSETLNSEVKRLGDTTVGKVEDAFDAETIANLKKIAADVAASTQDMKEGIAAAKATFEQAKDIVGLKSADGKTLAETIDSLSSALGRVDTVLAQNSNQISDVMGGLDSVLKQLEATLKDLGELARNLKGRKDN